MDALDFPAFFKSEDDRSRKYFELIELGRALLDIEPNAPQRRERIYHFLERLSVVPFYGLDDSLRELMEIRGQILSELVGPQVLLNPPAMPGKAESIRLVVAISDLKRSPELASAMAHIAPKKGRFNVCVVHMYSSEPELAAEIKARGFQVLQLPEKPLEAAQLIYKERPHIVMYAANISSAFNKLTILASLRLAPMQVATTMSPVTTGLHTIDYYLTGNLNEIGDSKTRYTEELLFIEGHINRYDKAFLDPIIADKKKSGTELVSTRPYLIASANFYKLNEDCLRVWFELLIANPGIDLKLCPYGPSWAARYPREQFEAWVSELSASCNLNPDRISFHGPFTNRAPLLHLIEDAILYLDSFPYVGAVSLLDVEAAGTPYVTLVGEQARFRQSIYRGPNAIAIITHTISDYIHRACEHIEQQMTVAEPKRNSAKRQIRSDQRIEMSRRVYAKLASVLLA
jgi:predicted O-linked N-acetylglucosamine transferase (SPINDLY family)